MMCRTCHDTGESNGQPCSRCAREAELQYRSWRAEEARPVRFHGWLLDIALEREERLWRAPRRANDGPMHLRPYRLSQMERSKFVVAR